MRKVSRFTSDGRQFAASRILSYADHLDAKFAARQIRYLLVGFKSHLSPSSDSERAIAGVFTYHAKLASVPIYGHHRLGLDFIILWTIQASDRILAMMGCSI